MAAQNILYIYDESVTPAVAVNYSKQISFKVSYNKLWSPDTGRSMTGANKGTLIGIFVKLECQVGRQTPADRAKLLQFLMQPRLRVRYFDTAEQAMKTAYFYANDQTDELKNIKRSTAVMHAPMSFNLIANNKRT